MSVAVSPLRLRLKDNGRALTLDEFLDAEEREGYRYELARGVLEVTKVPRDEHVQIIWKLISAIADFDRLHPGLIRLAGGGADFRLCIPGLESGRNPDVAVVLQNTPINVRGYRSSSLVIEVVSKSKKDRQRDYVVKREEYLAYGLLEYWIVDPFVERIVVLLRDGFTWVERVFRVDDTAEGLVLPGFQIEVAELFDD